jgi:hypothetical protein
MKLAVILFVAALCASAAPPAPKAKAVAKAPAAKPKAASTPAAAVRKPAKAVAPKTASTAYRGKIAAKAPASRVANARAMYSRTPSRAVAGRRTVAVRQQPVVFVPQVPSPERYRDIQQALAEKGFYKGEVNGTWTPESLAALKEFQRAQSLEPDGKLGSLSLIALGLGPKRITAAQNTPTPALPQPQQ